MPGIWDDFLRLIYPVLCITCGRKLLTQEEFICLRCISDLPRTNFHTDKENKVAQLFWGRVEVENAAAWLFFRKGSRYQRLIHYLKYKGVKELGEYLGRIYGRELGNSSFMDTDLVVPVPLHPKKIKARGYNQSEWIARGIARGMGKEVSADNLIRSRITSTQTRKNRFERWQNVEGIFTVQQPEQFFQKHILVIDDVVTTGSTLEAAASALLQAGVSRVSIAALASAEI